MALSNDVLHAVITPASRVIFSSHSFTVPQSMNETSTLLADSDIGGIAAGVDTFFLLFAVSYSYFCALYGMHLHDENPS